MIILALLEYKCPNCGGAIEFDTLSQQVRCPFCESIMDMQALMAMDKWLSGEQHSEAMSWGYEGGYWNENEQLGLAVYSCNSCGGEIVGDETLGATSCPFCGNPVVMTSKFSGTLRPDIIIPFKLGKDIAIDSLQKHYMNKRLLPAVFKDLNHIDEVKGIYVPFWLFNADADAGIEYSASKVRSWSDRKYDYAETSHFHVYREGSLGFDQVPADGSRAIDDTLMESIEPFAMVDAVPFSTVYFAGYFANKYDVDADERSTRANERILNSTQTAFRDTVTGYNSVTIQKTNINLLNNSVQYALLPVWLLSTSWQGKSFLFAMNGQSGKFVGDLPLDKKAAWGWFFKLFGLISASLIVISQIIVSFI